MRKKIIALAMIYPIFLVFIPAVILEIGYGKYVAGWFLLGAYMGISTDILATKHVKRILTKNRKGQFTILALFTLFITLLVTVQFMPQIYSICENVSQIALAHGDYVTAYLVKLIPVSIVLVEIASIYYYAKPYIIREE